MTDGRFLSAYFWQYLFSIGGATGEGNMVLSLYCLYIMVLTEAAPIGREQISTKVTAVPHSSIPSLHSDLNHSDHHASICWMGPCFSVPFLWITYALWTGRYGWNYEKHLSYKAG